MIRNFSNNLKNAAVISIIAGIFAAIALSSCSGTNNVNMTVNQGQCVQLSQYSSTVAALEVESFPFLTNNPKTSPYCVSITLQNNSNGTNANTIEISNPGLVVTGLPNEPNPPAPSYDPAAANVTISPGTQVVGNIALFDPENCATINGANVATVSPGTSCTFYLQLTSQMYAVGTYPLNIAYNYTNGNQNFVQSLTINQRVFLYAGTNNGLFSVNSTQANGQNSSIWSVADLPNLTTSNIMSITDDMYGYLYFAVGNIVYSYNGLTSTVLGSSLPQNITSLITDGYDNLYAATNGAGIYIYNKTLTPNAWSQFTDSNNLLSESSAILGIASNTFAAESNPKIFYATTESGVFQCSLAESFATSCAFNNISESMTSFNPQALTTDSLGNLYLGQNQGAMTYVLNPESWSSYMFSPNSITGNVFSLANPHFITSPTTIYLAESGATNSQESSVFTCVNTFCVPLVSSTNKTIYGNINQIVTDGAGYVYVTGSGIGSADFAITTESGVNSAYLYVGAGGSVWQSVESGALNTNVQTMSVASMLTTY